MRDANLYRSLLILTARTIAQNFVRSTTTVALSLIVVFSTSADVRADDADARRLLQEMSDYLAAQQALSFAYDATLEVVTADDQKLELASSGTIVLNRPDKIRTTRSLGFADAEVSFDGETLTVLGKYMNHYAQIDVPGTVDNLIDELRDNIKKPLPAADLIASNPHDALMLGVVDVKDLGSGVIGGVECDYLAFRAEEVDWQIWIAQGEDRYPCRYVITSKLVAGGPQYSIQFRDWRTGNEVAATEFTFMNPTNATRVEPDDLVGTDDLPAHFMIGASQ